MNLILESVSPAGKFFITNTKLISRVIKVF